MPFEKGNTLGKRWVKGQSGNTAGRPKGTKNTFNLFLNRCKKEGIEKVSKRQYLDALGYLMNLTIQELTEIKTDTKQPLALRLLTSDFLDTKKGAKMRIDYRNFLFGKATQDIEKIEKKTFSPQLEKVIADTHKTIDGINSKVCK